MYPIISNCISLERYNYLLSIPCTTQNQCFEIARYPFVSFVQYAKDNIKENEIEVIHGIEEHNIYNFFYVIGLLLGVGEKNAIDTIHRNVSKEPLRSAIIIANQENNLIDKQTKFIEQACLILLSLGKTQASPISVINIRLEGKLPNRFFPSKLEKKGDEWFRLFVEYKLKGLTHVYKYCGAENAYPFIAESIAYSLYSFNPNKYYIQSCNTENDAVFEILNQFLTNIPKK